MYMVIGLSPLLLKRLNYLAALEKRYRVEEGRAVNQMRRV
jgi:hypothetical protein